jgi:aminoglycoside phosphotransferase (APT) family kinase protein
MAEANENPRFAQLVQRIAPAGKLLRTWRLTGGISAGMTALEVEYPDGQTRRMVVRRPGEAAFQRNPRAARDEYRLLQMMQLLGPATQRPCYLDESGHIFSTPYLVVDYIEGNPEFAPTDVDSFTRQCATHLAQIHSIDGSALDLSFLPRHGGICTEPAGSCPASAEPWWDEERIRARLASIGPLSQGNRPALLHGDYWPGNLLWRKDKLIAVIDWEDAKLGDPLVDLAISRLDFQWIFGMDAMNAFTQHYRSVMDQSMTALGYSNLPYWDLCAALRLARLAGADPAGWVAFFQPYGRHDITLQTLREAYHLFIKQALEQLAAQ